MEVQKYGKEQEGGGRGEREGGGGGSQSSAHAAPPTLRLGLFSLANVKELSGMTVLSFRGEGSSNLQQGHQGDLQQQVALLHRHSSFILLLLRDSGESKGLIPADILMSCVL